MMRPFGFATFLPAPFWRAEAPPTLPFWQRYGGAPFPSLMRGEAVATLREVALLARDIAPVLPVMRAGDDVVVLVHGFMASAGVFRPMRARLEREAMVRVASFSHAPGAGVEAIARKLADVVAQIPEGTRIHVVGHSLGGIVARWFVQELGGHARVTQTISLASPFGGAHVAKKIPLFVGADLHHSSAILARLRKGAHKVSVPHTSIVAGDDKMVGRPDDAIFCQGDAVVMPGRGHNTLLFDDEVARHVIDRLRRHRI